MDETAQILGMIRDGLLIAVFLLAIVVPLVIWRRVSSVLKSAQRTMKSVEDVADALSSKIVGPATAGSGVAFGAGKVASFFLGLTRRKSKGGKDDGE